MQRELSKDVGPGTGPGVAFHHRHRAARSAGDESLKQLRIPIFLFLLNNNLNSGQPVRQGRERGANAMRLVPPPLNGWVFDLALELSLGDRPARTRALWPLGIR